MVTLLLIVALGFGVYIWYIVQKLDTSSVNVSETTQSIQSTQEISVEKAATTNTESIQQPIVIETNTLSESQQKILNSLGYNGDSITITPNMVICAEEAVGQSRLDEILLGAIPNPLESINLIHCFNR